MKPPRLESPAKVARDVLRIFVGDVRYGVKNVIGIIVLMGLVLVPPMYAWFNIAGSWDPYGHTEGLKVAVANEDAGYESDLTPVDINMGDAVVSSLRADDSFDWVFVSEDEAVEGIRSGRYYAAIVIPEGFSADMMTLFSPDVTHSEITYYTNEKENPIAPRITEKGAASVQDSVRVKFTETVDKAALSLASDLVSYLDGDQVSTYAARMDGHMADAVRDMRSAEGDMRAFSSLMTAASGLSDASASMLSWSKDASSGAASSITDAASGLSDASDSFDAATGAVQGALAQSLAGFDGLDAEVTSALDDAQGRSSDASAILRSAAQEAEDSRVAYESVRDAVAAADTSGEATAAIDRVIAELAALQQNLGDAADALDAGTSDASAQIDTVRSSIADAKASISDVSGSDDLRKSLDALTASLGDISTKSSTVASDLADVAGSLSRNAGSLSSRLSDAASSLDDAADKLDDTASYLDESRGKLAAALASGNLDEVRTILNGGSDALAEYLASPVRVDRQAVYGVANNGSAMAPFYTVLSLWVGAIILAAMMRTRIADRRLLELGMPSPAARYFGRFGIFSLLSFGQALLVCLGDLFVLQIQCVHPVLFVIAGIVAGQVFMLMMYTLTAMFNEVGKAVAVILLVMQVAGSGGTFPIEMTGPFFQAVYPFLPFTHGMNAMAACVAGIYGGEFAFHVVALLAFAIPTLLVALALRGPALKLNDFVDGKLAETKFM
ncbi:YhgE/Pip family protein [Slackia exigua]